MTPRPRPAATARPRRGAGGREPQKPRPPAALDLAVLPGHDLVPEATLRQLGFFDIGLSERTAESVELEQCRFRQADLSGCSLDQVTVIDCLFEQCDLANLRAEGGALTRSRVSGSRMTGFTWTKGLVKDVVFRECRTDLTAWRFTDFTAVRFQDCQLTQADFTEANLTGAEFVGCDLTAARFDHCTMAGARFRGCTLDGVGGIESFAGAILDEGDLPALARTLAVALGIRIERPVG